MFALALWDQPRCRLVLARDRMGQKPLFYAPLPGGGLAFGSEPKAILRHPEVGRDLDLDSLARYLFYEYIPAPHSIWRGLRKLPRGHVLVWEKGDVRLVRYWQSPGPCRRSSESRSSRFRGLLGSLPWRGGAAPPVGRSARGVPLGRHRFLERGRGALRA